MMLLINDSDRGCCIGHCPLPISRIWQTVVSPTRRYQQHDFKWLWVDENDETEQASFLRSSNACVLAG